MEESKVVDWKVGDMVECVDNSSYGRHLTVGNHYEVIEIGERFTIHKSDRGDEISSFHHRFKKVEDRQKESSDLTINEELPGGSTPSQYALPADAKELQDLIEFREMNFAMGNIFKACYREKESITKLYDIRKIIFFAQREEARLMEEQENV